MSNLEIHFVPDSSEEYVTPIVDGLWLQNVSFVDGILRGEAPGKISIGGLWTWFVDLDGLDVWVRVESPNAELTATLYAKYVTDILVNGVSRKTW